MMKHHALKVLFEHRSQLDALGVSRAGVFGSQARSDSRPDSDTDIIIFLKPDVISTLFEMAAIQIEIERMFGAEIDVAFGDMLLPHVKASALNDAIYAFA